MSGNEMKLVPGLYTFECDPMPWTELDLGMARNDVGNYTVEVSIELSDSDIQALVSMLNWAWDSDWFEYSMSETVCSELLKLKAPKIYDKVHKLAHQQFSAIYTNSDGIRGYGVYEIFVPVEIEEMAKTYWQITHNANE